MLADVALGNEQMPSASSGGSWDFLDGIGSALGDAGSQIWGSTIDALAEKAANEVNPQKTDPQPEKIYDQNGTPPAPSGVDKVAQTGFWGNLSTSEKMMLGVAGLLGVMLVGGKFR